MSRGSAAFLPLLSGDRQLAVSSAQCAADQLTSSMPPAAALLWAAALCWPAHASWGPEDSLVLEDRSLLSPAYSPAPDQCPELTRKYDDAMVVLQNLQDGMLEDMCGQKECDKVIVTSMGLSAVKQPTRWGMAEIVDTGGLAIIGHNPPPTFQSCSS